ncbi:MAG: response regulator [Alphaproteobacteria bacterium]|nr:response regulator [Alphaproteobacteria bacterium]
MLRCIIADDSKIMRMLLRKIMENLNFYVDEAEDGEEVIELCAQTSADLIISDWDLPLMDGIDVLYKIRSDCKIKQPKFIFCSYQKDPQIIRQALDGGADDFIMRPFDEDIIAAKLVILKLV